MMERVERVRGSERSNDKRDCTVAIHITGKSLQRHMNTMNSIMQTSLVGPQKRLRFENSLMMERVERVRESVG